MSKKRLDLILTERGLAPTRTRAQTLIMAGQVSAEGRIYDKPGQLVDESLEIHLKEQPRYVSRAGDKLASVAQDLQLDFNQKVVLDVGSSTGGFTDFALQNGAMKVYCVDVGTGQLSYNLRQDSRVIVMEQTDIRDAKLPELADMAVIDVSFISLKKIMESVAGLLKPNSKIVAMAKPQFEAGKELADKHHGVIPLGQERDEVLADLRAFLTESFVILGEATSGLAGAEGNVEYFFLLKTR